MIMLKDKFAGGFNRYPGLFIYFFIKLVITPP